MGERQGKRPRPRSEPRHIRHGRWRTRPPSATS